MMEKPLFITWQPVLTDHQAFTYEGLSRQAETPVLAYVLTMEDATRRAQGWRDTQVESIERRLIPERGTFLYCYQKMREHRHDIHLFGSAFQSSKMLYCLLLAVALRVEFYIVSEPYSPISQGYFSDGALTLEKLKAKLRPFLYKIYMALLKQSMSGVFSISSKALSQYSDAGVKKDKLFPFGYFVPIIENRFLAPQEKPESSDCLRVIFVGALIARKGVDLLIEAIANSGASVVLDVYGPGDPSSFAFDGEKIRYCGIIPFGSTQAIVSSYDLLVLPSRYDGWGVVVNEALCAGVPVLCSDQVGARVLVEKFGAGAVFDSNDHGALERMIGMLCSEPEHLVAMRAATHHAAAAIQPVVAADYMLAVLRAKPECKAAVVSPWYPKESLQ
ncbi:glycosyltransferase family 4 protein [Pseudomonas gingeri]|uniref:glycosyltransferase family 4 protein n=1 Tax=Pseudomonas gingeri TaxID=117681 RepID=UPI0015A27C98|nr:glycosyltransferase family 4 protein [Pseudomonas gingeri]NWA04469.1 glycosyltransferase family 4 protein [Pseudomonas gingeri]NWA15554.1 glycosyltransferase family 4 protein [Pseudomonas gingeri]NWA58274.1 glycosyltransferase family 4 protein [Pseudomonas gingeri]NWA96050.1 glycosyltransferase family 4 protein [Pseudomonas gingeri]NWB04584.1 glycosyltransferase family 4 protein [Pseudomonas gingeri]